MLKRSKLFLALTLSLLLCFVSIATAFAAPTLNDKGALTTTQDGDPIAAAITKLLKMPTGTNVPDAVFTFDVAPKTVDGDPYDNTNMPTLGPVSINFGDTQDPPVKIDPPPASDTDGWYKESADLFKNVDGNTFPHAGEYVYEVTERSGTNSAIDGDSVHNKLTYSEAKYTLRIYVANNLDGKGNVIPGTYIYGLGTTNNTADNGQMGSGLKVDPTPGGNGDTTVYSQMIFTNTYVRTNGTDTPGNPDPTDPDESTLTVSKIVSGGSGNEDEYFTFNITLSIPALVTPPNPYYRAYVVDSTGVIDPVNNANSGLIGTDTGNTPNLSFIRIATTGATTFQLKHGQSLVFVATPVGVGYDIVENASDHAPQLIVTTAGTAAPVKIGSIETALDSGAQLVGDVGKDATPGIELNKAAFNNVRDFLTPTGLSMNDLPFIGLVILAIGALTAFIVVKSRKGKKNYDK